MLPVIKKLYYLKMFHVSILIGDLTDAKTKDKMGSMQILEEWQHYKQVIDETNVKEKTLWLDVRGNHGEKINGYILYISLVYKVT